uniref:Ribosomal protein S6 n=1 Tax=Picea sitchensis TaxID=3332 RepID=D5ADT1_PICSI|nr:unknown [Picea sitchensis]
MPLYDCMLLLKPKVERTAIIELVARLGRRVHSLNGVVTDIKSFGKVYLGYGIKKLDGRFYQGQMMQMTMMVTPKFPKELEYLNKDDRLLRWLLVKYRDTSYGLEFVNESDSKGSFYNKFANSDLFEDDEVDDDDEEYELEESVNDESKQENTDVSQKN